MSLWFRWYEGTTEDGKFRVTARNASVTVRDVIALWAFLLEDASSDKHRGVCTRNEDFMASVLDFENGVVERILEAMEELNMISVGHGAITIINWDKRQFETDKTDGTNAERQRRFRARQKETETKRESNSTVTAEKRPETDTEADTDSVAKATGGKPPVYSDAKHELWGEGVPILKALGVSEREARSNIGRFLKSTNDDAKVILKAIERARDTKAVDPIAWITRALPSARAGPVNGKGGGFVGVMVDRYQEQQNEPDTDAATNITALAFSR
jgi:hypothetical protein